LNTLANAQQLANIPPTSWVGVAGIYPMPYTTSPVNTTPPAPNAGNLNNLRNSVRIPNDAGSSVPVVFGCDYDADGIFDEDNDGEWLPCNYLNWANVTAYADWACLRPMTELEFEKACRGPRNPVPLEYAWGSTLINAASYDSSTLVDPGTANEGIASGKYSTTTGNACRPKTAAQQYQTYNNIVRCGIYAANSANTGRMTSGASYYGIMELSGNVWERAVTVGNSAGRAFDGSHGDGLINTNGTATNANWPPSSGSGAGFRGGSFLYDSSNIYNDYLRVSDRSNAAYASSGRNYQWGGRAVRTAD